MKFKKGDIVRLKISSEKAMILYLLGAETNGMFKDELPAYKVRLSNFDKKIVSEFELEKVK